MFQRNGSANDLKKYLVINVSLGWGSWSASDWHSGKRSEFVGCGCHLWGQNPDLGVPTPRPPVERRGAAPQTPLHKGRSVGNGARFALASQWEFICGWGLLVRFRNQKNETQHTQLKLIKIEAINELLLPQSTKNLVL